MEGDEELNDSFAVSPRDVLSQGRQDNGYSYGPAAQQYKQMGMNPLAGAQAAFSSKGGASSAMGGGSAKSQKPPSPASADAMFYANDIGDHGAAAALMNSKDGSSSFQIFDPYDFDLGEGENGQGGKTTMRIVPKGERDVPTPQGPKRMAVWEYAHARGVKAAPFKGGDENARGFRDLIGQSQGLLTNLSKLEQLYKNNAILTGFGPSEASTEARGLESRVLLDFAKIMSGAKGLGGQVSDRDLAVFQAMTPQRASAWFTRLRGNEMNLLKKVRAQTLDKLKTTAHANGLDFLPERQEAQREINTEKYRSKSISFE